MRLLRVTMSLISLLLIGLSSVIWYQSIAVVDYTSKQTSSLHFLGKRMFLLQKLGFQVMTLEATAQDIPLVHAYNDSILALASTVSEIATVNLAVVSGSDGILGPSTTAEVCWCSCCFALCCSARTGCYRVCVWRRGVGGGWAGEDALR